MLKNGTNNTKTKVEERIVQCVVEPVRNNATVTTPSDIVEEVETTTTVDAVRRRNAGFLYGCRIVNFTIGLK